MLYFLAGISHVSDAGDKLSARKATSVDSSRKMSKVPSGSETNQSEQSWRSHSQSDANAKLVFPRFLTQVLIG